MGAVKDSLRVKKAGPRLASRQRYAQPCFCFSDFFIQHVAVVGLLARWHRNFLSFLPLSVRVKHDCFIQLGA
jgi:hypothetical protein